VPAVLLLYCEGASARVVRGGVKSGVVGVEGELGGLNVVGLLSLALPLTPA
jgi:hypothetical protein